MTGNTYTAVYTTFAETEAAITQLQSAGFDMKRLSVAGTDHGMEKHLAGCYNTGNGLRYAGTCGLQWTRLSTKLSGWGEFLSSENGLVLVMGPLVQAIVTGQEDNSPITGMGDFGAGLSAIGIPIDSIVQYERALMNHKFLLFVDGDVDEIDRAHHALVKTNPVNGALHHGAVTELEAKIEKGKAPCYGRLQ
jgi:hypothetical protein